MYIGLHVKCPLFLSDFNETWIFWTGFRRKLKNQISWKSVQWEPSFSVWKDGRTERQKDGPTDMTKLIVVLLNLSNAPKKHAYITKINSVNFHERSSGREQPDLTVILLATLLWLSRIKSDTLYWHSLFNYSRKSMTYTQMTLRRS
jgi:hypothetical protein